MEWLSCRQLLVGASFGAASKALAAAWRRARRRGPCLLVLDDLDSALPNTAKDDADMGGGAGPAGDVAADALVEVCCPVRPCVSHSVSRSVSHLLAGWSYLLVFGNKCDVAVAPACA